ncbi:MAG: type II toxin-antitoxin system VapC family toxin [Pirellulaceae bacterium]
MARELFIDTSGFYAILVERDPKHATAERILKKSRAEKRLLLTTDYVLDETATLLKARGAVSLVEPLFDHVFESRACRIEWMSEDRFAALRVFYRKHADQEWSLTDCLSFCIMKELKLQDALTADVHFEQAGFVALLR